MIMLLGLTFCKLIVNLGKQQLKQTMIEKCILQAALECPRFEKYASCLFQETKKQKIQHQLWFLNIKYLRFYEKGSTEGFDLGSSIRIQRSRFVSNDQLPVINIVYRMIFKLCHDLSCINIINCMASKRNNSLDNYKKMALLGEGAFAKVYLVRCQQDQEIYALKAINKKIVLQTKQQKSIIFEKKVLSQINHPFLVKSKQCFQDHHRLYFVLDYCPGGELFRILSLREKLPQPQVKFLTAQIVLAIEALHEHDVIYCDLKPQNVLIDNEGYIKVTDFGLAKNLKGSDQQVMLVCGTPEYMAPELLKKEGYSKSIDWWCLGCMIYEMVTGLPPFYIEDRKELFKAIIQKPFYMPSVSPAMQNILISLLQKNPKERLGTKSSAEVKKHHWFKGVDWNQLKNKSYGSPFAPELSSEDDLSNFDIQFTGSSIHEEEEQQGLPTQFDFQGFHHIQ